MSEAAQCICLTQAFLEAIQRCNTTPFSQDPVDLLSHLQSADRAMIESDSYQKLAKLINLGVEKFSQTIDTATGQIDKRAALTILDADYRGPRLRQAIIEFMTEHCADHDLVKDENKHIAIARQTAQLMALSIANFCHLTRDQTARPIEEFNPG